MFVLGRYTWELGADWWTLARRAPIIQMMTTRRQLNVRCFRSYRGTLGECTVRLMPCATDALRAGEAIEELRGIDYLAAGQSDDEDSGARE